MRAFRLITGMILILPLIFSCSKELKVNADWQDITIVYGLLNQNDSVHYVKITKAFLGEGNSLIYAKNPDSSNYPVGDLDVKMQEFNGSTLVRTFTFDTTMIHNKLAGDSIFYFPNQLVYKTVARLSENHTYKLKIKNLRTNKEITSQTELVNRFEVVKPGAWPEMAHFAPGVNSIVSWYPAKGGKRYQLVIRFHYSETKNFVTEEKYIDWMIFNNVKLSYSNNLYSKSIPGESFFTFLQNHLVADPSITRAAGALDYIFTVASPDLNTYMEVTEPSTSIVQERPAFTNIQNGIGIFSSRYDNTKDNPINIFLDNETKLKLTTNIHTAGLNF